MRVPPGVSESDFAAALKQFETVVGKDWIFTSDEDVELYRDSFSPFWHEAEDSVPSAAVAPDGLEQVQAIVKIANTYKIPLWTISTGKNLAYGGSAPRLSGSVVLDLKRMNRILEVNETNAYALVEPGVSYFDLYNYIQEHKLKVWIDPPDPGWGSPVGNSLERGGGRGPLHDHFATVCGLEVVLPDGELMRTGMGAMPGSKTWQQYRYGFGPYVDGMFSQSNFGIVTKMGVWLLPEPEAYRDGTVMVARHDDLVPFVEILAYLYNSQIVQGTMALDSPLLTYRVSKGGGVVDLPGDISVAELGADRPRTEHSVLERRAAFLRTGQGRRSSMGIYERKILGDSRRYFQRRPFVSLSCETQGLGRRPATSSGHSQSSSLRVSRQDAGPHGFFADHPSIGRGRFRSSQGVWRRVPRDGRAATKSIHLAALGFLPARVRFLVRLSHHARCRIQ